MGKERTLWRPSVARGKGRGANRSQAIATHIPTDKAIPMATPNDTHRKTNRTKRNTRKRRARCRKPSKHLAPTTGNRRICYRFHPEYQPIPKTKSPSHSNRKRCTQMPNRDRAAPIRNTEDLQQERSERAALFLHQNKYKRTYLQVSHMDHTEPTSSQTPSPITRSY